MTPFFRTDASLDLPALAHADGCRCALHGRRLFTGALLAGAAGAALGQPTEEGVRSDVGN